MGLSPTGLSPHVLVVGLWCRILVFGLGHSGLSVRTLSLTRRGLHVLGLIGLGRRVLVIGLGISAVVLRARLARSIRRRGTENRGIVLREGGAVVGRLRRGYGILVVVGAVGSGGVVGHGRILTQALARRRRAASLNRS